MTYFEAKRIYSNLISLCERFYLIERVESETSAGLSGYDIRLTRSPMDRVATETQQLS